MVYHVYLNWTGDLYNGRELLVFATRQHADEFYNRCIETTSPKTENPLTDITRHTPQFWSFPGTIDESRPFYFTLSNARDLIPTYMAARISGYDNNHATGAMPVIANDATGGTEYRSGGAVYVRTKAVPHLYWFYTGVGNVCLSEKRRSKFRIEREVPGGTTPAEVDARRVLERKDVVRVTALHSKNAAPVGVFGSHVATADSVAFQFVFGSFYNGDFGVDWATGDANVEALVSYQTLDGGDEWELVN